MGFSRGVGGAAVVAASTLLGVALAAACGTFTGTDTGDPPVDASAGASDAGAADGAAVDEAALDGGFDGGGDAAVASPFCAAHQNATFCDDFNRAAAVSNGAPWASASCAGGTLGIVNGMLSINYGLTTASAICFLASDDAPASSLFTLDFDFSYTTDASSTTGAIVAAVTARLPSVNDAGVQSLDLQLLLDGTGTGKTVAVFYEPGAPMGSQYPGFVLGQASGFMLLSTPCHVTLSGNFVTPAVSASATCNGKTVLTSALAGAVPHGVSGGVPVLNLGFSNPSGVATPAWTLTDDNMVFVATP